MSSFFFSIRRISRHLWIRAALIMALAFVSALTAPALSWILPEKFAAMVTEEKVRTLLDILSNSMLAVTTFSVATMVTAHLAADQAASPRAHRILREDGRTQTALATFVGTFVYSLVAIVMIQLDIIKGEELGVAYLMTLLVLAIVIVTILRWVEHLSALGSVEATTRTAETGAIETLKRRMETPYLGGCPLTDSVEIPEDSHSVPATGAGYLQYVDVEELSDCMGERGGNFFVRVTAGDWIGPGDTLGYVSLPDLDEEFEETLRGHFRLGETRTLDQDTDFGVSVLTEIAERALSPGINDPRTAIDVSSRLLSMLVAWEGEERMVEPKALNVFVPPVDIFSLVRSAFEPIARDGKAFVEVQMTVQEALARLARHRVSGIAEAARVVSHRALAYAEIGLALDADRARVRAVAPADFPAPARIQPEDLTVGQTMERATEG